MTNRRAAVPSETFDTPDAELRTRYRRRYLSVALLLGLLVTLVGLELAGKGPSSWFLSKTVHITMDGETYLVSERQLEQVLSARPKALGSQVNARAEALNQRVTTEINLLFDDAVQRVPDYLDLHYSLRGNVLRAAAWVVSKISGTEDATSGYAERILGGESWDNKIQEIEVMALQAHNESLSTYVNETTRWLAQQLKSNKTDLSYHDSGAERQVDVDNALVFTPDIFQIESAAVNFGRSAIAGAMATSGAALARQTMIRRAASRTASRVAGASAAAPCIASGPVAAVCGGTVFATVTVGTEIALIKTEEYFEREDYEQVLLAQIERLREQALYQMAAKPAEQIIRQREELARRFESKIKPVDLL